MIQLTEIEKKMLNGDMGRFKQIAIQNIIQYAKVLNADRLCEVTKATLYLGAHPYLEAVKSENYDEIFSKMYMCTDEKVELGMFSSDCSCQTCVAPSDQFEYEPLNLSKEFFDKNNEYLNRTKESGVVIMGSCTPYLTGWIPLYGEHFVTTESSNVLMSNAIFGARGNSDGIEAAAWSAVCGRTPYWGNHVPENRYGTHIFNIKCSSDSVLDWDLIGYTIGRTLPSHAVPVVNGTFKRPDIIKLKQFFASLATTSGAEMCHIVGVTPEAVTLKMAIGENNIIEEIDITEDDIRDSYRMLCDLGNEDLQMVTLGCPHYSIQEIRLAALYLEGKKVNKNVKLYIWTDIPTKAVADVNGYTNMIKEAGGHLLTSSCPLVIGKKCFDTVEGMAMDGAKQAHYMRSETEANIFYGDMYKCIDSAVLGKWVSDFE